MRMVVSTASMWVTSTGGCDRSAMMAGCSSQHPIRWRFTVWHSASAQRNACASMRWRGRAGRVVPRHAPCSVRTSRPPVTRSLVSSENRGRPTMATAATAASGRLCQRRPRMVTEWAHRARMWRAWRALPPLSALTSRCHRWILPKSVGLESGRILLAARRRSCSAVW